MNQQFRIVSFGVVAAFLLFAGCKKDRLEDSLLVKAGNKEIGKRELLAQSGLYESGAVASVSTEAIQKAAEQWAMNQILIQEATRRQLDQDSFFQAELSRIRSDLLIQSLYADLDRSIYVGDEEIQEEYDLHRQDYTTPSDQIDLIYILCPNRDTARQVRTQLQNGEELAMILSTDYTLEGEHIGWVTHHDLNNEIADIAFALVPGGISSPIQFNPGQYIVMQCRQRRQAGTVLPLDEVESVIKQRLFTQKKLHAEKALRDSLWIAYNPRIFLEAIETDSANNQP